MVFSWVPRADHEAVSAFPRRLRRLVVALRYVGASRFSAATLLTARRSVRPPAAFSRAAHITASAVLAGLAVELLVEARLGLTPFDAVAFGVGERLGLTLGQSGWLLAGGLFAFAAALGRRPTPWSMGWIFLCGLTIDGSAGLLASTDDMAARVIFLFAGIGLMAACVGVLVNADAGGGPAELIMLAGADRGASVLVVRMVFDAAILASAVLVGGPVAIGTLAYALLMGPTIQVVNQAFADHRAGRENRLADRSARRVAEPTAVPVSA